MAYSLPVKDAFAQLHKLLPSKHQKQMSAIAETVRECDAHRKDLASDVRKMFDAIETALYQHLHYIAQKSGGGDNLSLEAALQQTEEYVSLLGNCCLVNDHNLRGLSGSVGKERKRRLKDLADLLSATKGLLDSETQLLHAQVELDKLESKLQQTVIRAAESGTNRSEFQSCKLLGAQLQGQIAVKLRFVQTLHKSVLTNRNQIATIQEAFVLALSVPNGRYIPDEKVGEAVERIGDIQGELADIALQTEISLKGLETPVSFEEDPAEQSFESMVDQYKVEQGLDRAMFSYDNKQLIHEEEETL